MFFVAPIQQINYVYLQKYIAAYLLIGLAGVFAIFRSGGMSNYIASRAGLDDSLTVYSKPQQLLSIMIVVVAVGQVLTRLPFITNALIALVRDTSPGRNVSGGTGSLAFNFFAILFPVLMIIFCRQLTVYFSKNI